jgi:hypothetical protein
VPCECRDPLTLLSAPFDNSTPRHGQVQGEDADGAQQARRGDVLGHGVGLASCASLVARAARQFQHACGQRGIPGPSAWDGGARLCDSGRPASAPASHRAAHVAAILRRRRPASAQAEQECLAFAQGCGVSLGECRAECAVANVDAARLPHGHSSREREAAQHPRLRRTNSAAPPWDSDKPALAFAGCLRRIPCVRSPSSRIPPHNARVHRCQRWTRTTHWAKFRRTRARRTPR